LIFYLLVFNKDQRPSS